MRNKKRKMQLNNKKYIISHNIYILYQVPTKLHSKDLKIEMLGHEFLKYTNSNYSYSIDADASLKSNFKHKFLLINQFKVTNITGLQITLTHKFRPTRSESPVTV